MIGNLLCDVVRLVLCASLYWCCSLSREVFAWFVCAVVCDVVWFVFVVCVFVCLCGVVLLNVFVCFVCELLCGDA